MDEWLGYDSHNIFQRFFRVKSVWKYAEVEVANLDEYGGRGLRLSPIVWSRGVTDQAFPLTQFLT